MNRLARAAMAAITDPAVESEAGFCQRFVRQVAQLVVGHEWDHLWTPSALESMAVCRSAGLCVTGPPEPGDLLYKGRRSGAFGHVGIYVGDGRVAENSSTKIGRVSGAKGYRTLSQFGTVDAIVRLPGIGDDQPHWAIVFPDGQKIDGYERTPGTVWAQVRSWAAALGLSRSLGWRAKTSEPTIGGRVPGSFVVESGSAWAPVRSLAEITGLHVRPEGGAITVYR